MATRTARRAIKMNLPLLTLFLVEQILCDQQAREREGG